MATNIEQIFRSFVVSKFREIQQELSSGRSEGQLNGETNTPIEGNQAGDDAAASARSLPNEEIVQKIEEVLSGVLDTELRCKPDKAQLLEIAKANAAAMCAKAGVPLPPNLKPAPPPTIEEKVAKKSGGATIEELTEKCKQIAQSKEDDDVIVNKPHVSDEEEEEPPFYHHPFKLSEPKPIFFNLNIAAAKPTPPKSQVTLTKEFPVSSGSQHRKKEADSVYGEWVPVDKNGEENKDDDNVFSSNLPSEGRGKRQGRVKRQMKQPAASHLTVTRCNSLCGTKPQSEKHRIAENSVVTSLPNIGPSLHLWEGSPRYNYLASRFASRLYSSRFWW